jgi:hypothetical protein
MPTVKEIIVKYLKENGYDGLCYTDCGCDIDDLAPCDCINDDCEAGHRMLCENPGCEYVMDCSGTCIRTKPEE